MNNSINWTELLNHLAEPFPEGTIKWRPGQTNRDKSKALALAYVDVRNYEDRLNAVCPGAWEVAFEPWGDKRIICRLTIHGTTRSSTGEEGDSPGTISGTAAEAQAFKRACCKFGLGRHLYSFKPTWMPYDAANKRLKSTPQREAVTSPVTAVPASQALKVSPVRLDRLRAAAMHRELAIAGIARSRHLGFASGVLQRQLRTFTGLAEVDARRVYEAATDRRSSEAAQYGGNIRFAKAVDIPIEMKSTTK